MQKYFIKNYDYQRTTDMFFYFIILFIGDIFWSTIEGIDKAQNENIIRYPATLSAKIPFKEFNFCNCNINPRNGAVFQETNTAKSVQQNLLVNCSHIDEPELFFEYCSSITIPNIQYVWIR